MSDHWNNLADLIGADVPKPEPAKEEEPPRSVVEETSTTPNDATSDVPSEPQEPKPPTPEQTPPAEEPPLEQTLKATDDVEGCTGPDTAASPPPEPSKPKNHWQKVAGALGLAFGKSDPKPAQPPAVETDGIESAVAKSVDKPASSSSEPTPTTADSASPAPPEKPSMFGFGWKSKAVEETDSPATFATPTESTPNAETLFGEATDDTEPEETYDKKHAERELAALFSDPVDTSIEGLDFTPGERTEEDTKPRYVDDLNVDDIPFDEPLDSEQVSPSSGPEPDDGESRSGRRRRRGGRRRRRGDKRQPAEDDRTDVDEMPSASDPSDATADLVAPTSSVGFGSGILDQEDADTPPADDASPHEAGSDDRRGKRFRNIRSWKDTISTIVDANLSARGNSPTPRGSNGGGRRRRGGARRGGGRSRSRRGGGAKQDDGNDSQTRSD